MKISRIGLIGKLIKYKKILRQLQFSMAGHTFGYSNVSGLQRGLSAQIMSKGVFITSSMRLSYMIIKNLTWKS